MVEEEEESEEVISQRASRSGENAGKKISGRRTEEKITKKKEVTK